MVYTIVDIIFLCDFEVALVARYVVPAFSCVDVGNLCIAGELDRLKLFDDVVSHSVCIRAHVIYVGTSFV